MHHTRRKFILQSSSTLLGLGLLSSLPFGSLLAKGSLVGANDTINVGLIGCKGMGWSNLKSQLTNNPELRCIALADVDQSVLDERTNDVEKLRGNRPKQFKDYRRMLEMKEIDVVIIGTPDHWHCLMFCDALSADKHVYCEKPLANSIEECNVMMAAAKRYPKMVQIGQWQRSGKHYQQAHNYLKSGKLGNIRLVKCWSYQGWMQPVSIKPDASVPQGVDYDMWLGPAPQRPFNPNRFHFNFRWYWDYAGGLMTDWGVHEIDIALYFMGVQSPKSVIASGGKLAYPDDASETPDTMQAVFEFEKFNMLWEHAIGIDNGPYGKSEGIAFIGNHGTLVVNRDGWSIIPETQRNSDGILNYEIENMPEQRKPNNADYLAEHGKNFVAAIKKNDASILACGIETGAVAAINAHMGNIAFKTGRKIYWDASNGTFKNDAEANLWMKTNYQNGWKLPVF
jgi:predicted dehydrogenase